MPFTVAIVGRPNVGKSTLFNRLIGKKLALVDDQPGLTRDRRQAETELGPCAVTFIDTAGLEPGDQGLTPRMRQQTEAAVAQADLVLFLIDARAGVVPADQMLAELVRGSGKPVILASVYNTLERLEEKRLVESTIGQPTAERGGRAKRYFSITTAGLREVRAAKKALTILWRGVPVHEG